MNRIAMISIAALCCFSTISPAVAQDTNTSVAPIVDPCQTVRKQRRQILIEHWQQVLPVLEQMGHETGFFVSDIGAIFAPQGIYLYFLWPQIQEQLDAAFQNAHARFQALPPAQQTLQAALEILVSELTPVFQWVVDRLGPTITQGQLTALENAINAYSANMASLAQQLEQITAETKAKLAALPPCR